MSRASAPVGIVSIDMVVLSPMRMIEPLPYCFSIWLIAISRALSRSTAELPSLAVRVWTAPPYGGGVTVTPVELHDCSCERAFDGWMVGSGADGGSDERAAEDAGARV